MNGEEADIDLNQWFSTYGVITSERILGTYKIYIEPSDLVVAIKSANSFYHNLLQVPLRNVLNGIILQQANDYHIYVQKLFIDYLLSGESGKGEEAQGAATRESLESERQQLVTLGDEFHKIQGKHDLLVGSSQTVLIRITGLFNSEFENAITSIESALKSNNLTEAKSKIRKAINHALVHCNMKEANADQSKSLFIEKMNEILQVSLTDNLKKKMVSDLSNLLQIVLDFDDQISNFIVEAQELSQLSNSFRTQFFDTIIRVNDLIKMLPEYKIDPEQDAINREPLYFDKTIGAL